MKTFFPRLIVVFFLVMPSAFAKSPDSGQTTKPLSAAIQADQSRLLADKTALETAEQSFKTALAKLRADEAIGDAAAVAEDEARLEHCRTLLHGIRQTMQADQRQLRKDVAIAAAADSAIVDKALAQLAKDKADGNANALAADEAALKSAREQVEADRQALQWELLQKASSGKTPQATAPAALQSYKGKIFADKSAIAIDRQILLKDSQQLRADEAAGNAAAVAADRAKVKADQDRLRADEEILRADMKQLGVGATGSVRAKPSSLFKAKQTVATTSKKAPASGAASAQKKNKAKSAFSSKFHKKSSLQRSTGSSGSNKGQ